MKKSSKLFQDSPSSIGLNELTLKFDESYEKKYMRNMMPQMLTSKRAGLIVGIIIFVVFALLDYVSYARADKIMWIYKLLIIIPMLGIGYMLTHVDFFKSKIGVFAPLMVVITSAVHFFSLKNLSPDVNAKFYMTNIILLIYAFTMMKGDFIWTVFMMFSTSSMYALFINTISVLSFQQKASIYIVLIVTVVLALIYAYHAEYIKRRSFYIEVTRDELLKTVKSMESMAQNANVNSYDMNLELQDLILDESELDIEVEKESSIYTTKNDNKDSKDKINSAKESEKFMKKTLSMVIQGMPKMSCVLNTDGSIKYISSSFANLILNKTGDKLNDKFSDYLNKLDKDRFEISQSKQHKDEELLKNTFSIKDKLGKYVNVFVTIGSFTDSDDTMYYIVFLDREQKQVSTIVEKNVKKEVKQNKEVDEVSSKKDAELINKLKADIESLEKFKASIVEDNNKLNTKNNLLMADLDNAQAKLREQVLKGKVESEDKFIEKLKMLNNIFLHYSYQISKYQKDLIEILEGSFIKFAELKDRKFVETYYSKNKHSILMSIYQSASIQYRLELYEYLYAKRTSKNVEIIDISETIQESFGDISKLFSYMGHGVLVSCKDNVKLKACPKSIQLIVQNMVLTSLTNAVKNDLIADIDIKVIDSESCVVVYYKDNCEQYSEYYHDVLKFSKIDSNVISVNGLEFYLIKEIMRKEFSGTIEIEDLPENTVRMVFYKK